MKIMYPFDSRVSQTWGWNKREEVTAWKRLSLCWTNRSIYHVFVYLKPCRFLLALPMQYSAKKLLGDEDKPFKNLSRHVGSGVLLIIYSSIKANPHAYFSSRLTAETSNPRWPERQRQWECGSQLTVNELSALLGDLNKIEWSHKSSSSVQ